MQRHRFLRVALRGVEMIDLVWSLWNTVFARKSVRELLGAAMASGARNAEKWSLEETRLSRIRFGDCKEACPEEAGRTCLDRGAMAEP